SRRPGGPAGSRWWRRWRLTESRRRRRERFLGLVGPCLVAVAPLVALVVRIIVDRPWVDLYGDQALTDIAAGRALSGGELPGPYSRYGWHHPGPAWLLLVGLVRRIGGGSSS